MPPPPVEPSDLIGAREIAERLGMAGPQVVHMWRTRHPDFPKPVAELDMGLIWSWPEVKAWARSTGRLKAT
jgi:predicted DNA-binding transcriptional regulator AlpA